MGQTETHHVWNFPLLREGRALDWHGVSYDEIGWPPGLHRVLLKRYGARGTTFPVLLDGKTVVQGSSAIIDWAESEVQDGVRSLNPRSANDFVEAHEIERRADEVIGIHARRLAYAELLQATLSLPSRRFFSGHRFNMIDLAA